MSKMSVVIVSVLVQVHVKSSSKVSPLMSLVIIVVIFISYNLFQILVPFFSLSTPSSLPSPPPWSQWFHLVRHVQADKDLSDVWSNFSDTSDTSYQSLDDNGPYAVNYDLAHGPPFDITNFAVLHYNINSITAL